MARRSRKLLGVTVFLVAVLLFSASSVFGEEAYQLYDRIKELIKQGMYDSAMVETNKAIELHPMAAEFYILRGELYRNKNDTEHAIPDYTKAIELNPANGEVYYFRAICYRFTGQYDLAWLDVHKAESLGYSVFPGFIKDLQQASGRDK